MHIRPMVANGVFGEDDIEVEDEKRKLLKSERIEE